MRKFKYFLEISKQTFEIQIFRMQTLFIDRLAKYSHLLFKLLLKLETSVDPENNDDNINTGA